MFEVFKNRYFIRNELARYIILIIWIVGNLVAFIATYFSYRNALEYFYLRKIVQEGVSVSRASAMCININCLLILLPVCRNLISNLRSCLCCSVSIKRGLFDKHITYHRYIGYAIIFFSIVHTIGHFHNFESLQIAYNSPGLLSTLSLLPLNKNGTFINPIRDANANVIGESFKFAAGITGIVLCIVLALFATTASEYIRRSFYNLFWVMHNVLAVLFVLCACLHGIQGIVRKQTNIDRNNPEKCYLKYTEWSPNNKECDLPQFAGSPPSTWIWMAGPLAIYLIERLTRFIRGFRDYKILNARLHPSNVLELQIDNNARRIKYTAGQYVYLNYPKISRFEWHPFTITSAPDDAYLSVHIRSSGDWTSELIKKIGSNRKNNVNENSFKIHVDGPYGSCAEDVFDYPKLVLIGAGIGCTPYASILKHICNMLKYKKTTTLNKVYFFWICPSLDTFEWFGEMLKNLENELDSSQYNDLLEYKIYLTKGWSLREARQIAENQSELYDLFTGLQQKTNYGRPNFELFFKDLSKSLTNNGVKEKVGVFFCGPPELSKELHKLCNSYSTKSVRFIYNKENF